MTQNNPQVPWTDEQWTRVNQVIQEEASRARVAATFLPLVGPLPGDADFVRSQAISYAAQQPASQKRMTIEDRDTIKLATLQIKVRVRTAQMADPEMVSVLSLFRRAANVLARLEDAVVFRGLVPGPIGLEPKGGLDGLQRIWEIHGGQAMPGLWVPHPPPEPTEPSWPDPPFPLPEPWQWIEVAPVADALVGAVSDAVGRLECNGHFGPFAAVFGQNLFLVAQTPNHESLVLPQDRIIPFLGGGPLLRSSTLDDESKYSGLVLALGGAPIELVVAADVSLQFIQLTEDPSYLFRVREKIALRVKEAGAIVRLYMPVPNGNNGDSSTTGGSAVGSGKRSSASALQTQRSVKSSGGKQRSPRKRSNVKGKKN